MRKLGKCHEWADETNTNTTTQVKMENQNNSYAAAYLKKTSEHVFTVPGKEKTYMVVFAANGPESELYMAKAVFELAGDMDEATVTQATCERMKDTGHGGKNKNVTDNLTAHMFGEGCVAVRLSKRSKAAIDKMTAKAMLHIVKSGYSNWRSSAELTESMNAK
jgi:hypothetical protein